MPVKIKDGSVKEKRVWLVNGYTGSLKDGRERTKLIKTLVYLEVVGQKDNIIFVEVKRGLIQ